MKGDAMPGGHRNLRCTCKHKDQDQILGKGIRGHNRCKPKTKDGTWWRCMVCLDEKFIPGKQTKKDADKGADQKGGQKSAEQKAGVGKGKKKKK